MHSSVHNSGAVAALGARTDLARRFSFADAAIAVFQTPPARSVASPLEFALGLDRGAPRIFATDTIYTVSSMTFMPAPHPTDLSTLRGAKPMVYRATSDPVFSSDGSAARGAGRGQPRRCVRLRALLPGAGDEPPQGRPRDRSVRPSDAAPEDRYGWLNDFA